MKSILFLLLGTLLFACKPSPTQNTIPLVNADSLYHHFDQFIGKNIRLEGKVLHICPVSGQKIKLRCNNNLIVKVIPADTATHFEYDWNGKEVCIEGKILQNQITRSEVDSMVAAGHLFCHIDHTACADTAWVNAMYQEGKAEESLKRYSERLYKIMDETQKDYIQVVVLVANQISEQQKDKE